MMIGLRGLAGWVKKVCGELVVECKGEERDREIRRSDIGRPPEKAQPLTTSLAAESKSSIAPLHPRRGQAARDDKVLATQKRSRGDRYLSGAGDVVMVSSASMACIG